MFKTKKVIIRNEILGAGEHLKKKREKLDLSVEDISEKLKIKVSYLKDLENGSYDKLPPDVYVKGFIRNYAALIGLDAEKIINVYKKEQLAKHKRIDVEKNVHAKKCKNKTPAVNYGVITPKIITVFFSFIILLIAGYYFWHQINSFRSTPYLFVSNPPFDIVVNKPKIEVKGETETDASLKINGEDVFFDSKGRFKEEILLKEGINVLIIESTNRFSKTAREKINVIYEKKLDPAPADDFVDDLSNGDSGSGKTQTTNNPSTNSKIEFSQDDDRRDSENSEIND